MSNASAFASPRWWTPFVDWITGHPRTLLSIGIGFQLFVLLGMIAFRAAPHVTGETVLLRVVPVDPRDMFRGDYVTLSYQFTRLSSVPGYGSQGNDPHDERRGQTVYVLLAPEADGKHWRPIRASLTRPTEGRFIRGTVAGWDRGEFGIESFYVQEGKGLEYEEAVRRRKLSAVVSIAPDGRAALRSLQIEDAP
jgi:uncharacterized membrane-anchored protein